MTNPRPRRAPSSRLGLFALALATIILGSAVACGASSASVTAARSARYATTYQAVWNAAHAELMSRYTSGLVAADPASGTLATQWTVVGWRSDSGLGEGSSAADQGMRTAELARAVVVISPAGGDGPFTVEVDVVAGEGSSTNNQIREIAHGAADEPAWVAGRRDALRVGIYNRLKDSVVVAAPPR